MQKRLVQVAVREAQEAVERELATEYWSGGPARFEADCCAALATRDPRAALHALMRAAFADPASVEAAFDNDVSRHSGPDRLAIVFSDDLTIMRVALDPGGVTPIHDHGIWTWSGVYRGVEDNVFYTERDGRLQVSGTCALGAGRVLEMPPDTIHAIYNRHPETSLAVHVYLGALHLQKRSMWNPCSWQREPLEMTLFTRYEQLLTEDGSAPLHPLTPGPAGAGDRSAAGRP